MIRTPPNKSPDIRHWTASGQGGHTTSHQPASAAWGVEAEAGPDGSGLSDSVRKSWKVSKTMQPDDRGAIQLAQTYGPDLVCVRHRLDHNGRTRHVTVELLIKSVDRPPRKISMVTLKLERNEREVRALILAAGGSWDSQTKLWHLPRRTAKILNLQSRIVGT